MAILTAAFNPAGATNGSNILVADAGDLTAWDAKAGSGGTITYDNTHTLFGNSLAAKFTGTLGTFLEWTSGNYGSPAEDFARFYIYFTALPGTGPVSILEGVVGNGFALGFDSSGHVVMQVPGTPPVAQATSTTVISTGQWYRLEYHYKTSSFAATVDIYTSPDSVTPAETITATHAFTAAANWAIGMVDAAHSTTYWLAQLAVKGTAAIGPYPVNTTAPTVSGSAPVGSTLTWNAGAWNTSGTFTITKQWQKDGVDIGGSTGSTYVTQAGDVGHAIGVREIATGVQATNESATQASSNTVTVTGAGASGSTFQFGADATVYYHYYDT